jgi:hypothetical protein
MEVALFFIARLYVTLHHPPLTLSHISNPLHPLFSFSTRRL